MNTKLTPEILKAHGFVELDKKDVIGRSIYDLMPNKGTYAFNIQVVLNPQYPESNPKTKLKNSSTRWSQLGRSYSSLMLIET